MRGKLEVITGPMFSGKSEELIRRLTRAKIAGKQIEVIKPNIDIRYDKDHVMSHAGASWRSNGVQIDRPQDIMGYHQTDIIAIDEVQFFDPGVVTYIMELVNEGIQVIVTGLDLDFKLESFGCMPALMAQADEVVKLKAVCINCGEDAGFTQRLTTEEDTVLVGGLESYEARCRECHYIPNQLSLF